MDHFKTHCYGITYFFALFALRQEMRFKDLGMDLKSPMEEFLSFQGWPLRVNASHCWNLYRNMFLRTLPPGKFYIFTLSKWYALESITTYITMHSCWNTANAITFTLCSWKYSIFTVSSEWFTMFTFAHIHNITFTLYVNGAVLNMDDRMNVFDVNRVCQNHILF